MHTSWIEHEFRTLQILFDAGCDVPKPYASDHNAILMDYVGDEGYAAPTLNGVKLYPSRVQRVFDQIVYNLEIMLDNERVHGDLSAYNILYWDGEITLIDFPQAINPNKNPNAYQIFQRDVTRICDYLITQGVSVRSKFLADDLWRSRGYSKAPNFWFEGLTINEDQYEWDKDRS